MNYNDDDDYVRPPDAANYDTLMQPIGRIPRQVQQPHRRPRQRRQRREINVPNARLLEGWSFTPQPPPVYYGNNTLHQRPSLPGWSGVSQDDDLALAIAASMQDEQAMLEAVMKESTEAWELDNKILQESAEQYERDCMLRADADSLDNCNIDRQLQITKAQCQKMARFDADYTVLAKWIQGGCIAPIDPHIKNKLKQVRLPSIEMDIIMMTTPDTQNREGWSLTPM